MDWFAPQGSMLAGRRAKWSMAIAARLTIGVLSLVQGDASKRGPAPIPGIF
jgi:hypothetical protein